MVPESEEKGVVFVQGFYSLCGDELAKRIPWLLNRMSVQHKINNMIF